MNERYRSKVKEERQAEFLVREFFPWTELTEVAVMMDAACERVQAALATAQRRPVVTIHPERYY